MEKDAAGSPQGHTNPGISRYLASRLPYARTDLRGGTPARAFPTATDGRELDALFNAISTVSR